jgi:NAD(P)-dependent dehydrogenase (short-subunit alcohol dehydrogenase family)
LNPKNKVALVTGSGKRIGKHIAISLAKTGSKVIIHYNESEEEALKTTEIINSNGGSAYPIKANLESSNEIFMMVDSIKKKYGNLDIIINNASKFNKDTVENIEVPEWDKMMAINFKAPFILAHLMYKNFNKKNIGKIINIGDWRTARKKRFSYGVSKSALSGLTKSLAISMAPSIQVNEIALGAILSPSDSKTKVKINLGPSNRPGTLEEVYCTVISLITNDFITGEKIVVDGGLHLQ